MAQILQILRFCLLLKDPSALTVKASNKRPPSLELLNKLTHQQPEGEQIPVFRAVALLGLLLQSFGGLLTIGGPLAQHVCQMAKPNLGDRIIVVRPHWFRLVFLGEADETRVRHLSPGRYWLGSRGITHGRIQLKVGAVVDSAENMDIASL